MTSGDRHPPKAGPRGLTGRVAAPDLARGFMLLLIVLANTTVYLYGQTRSAAGFHPVDGSLVDRVVQVLLITGVDLRVYPMFALLFGYGLAMLYRRQRENGIPEPATRRLLQRRNLWLVAFGAVHALLLSGGDILGAYGLCGLLLVWLFIRRTDRALLVWAGIGAGLLLVLTTLTALEARAVLAGERVASDAGAGILAMATATVSTEDMFAAAVARMTMWPIHILVIQGPFGLIVPVSILLGIWAGRRQILERPSEYRRLLWITAVGGIALGWTTGLVHALAHVGVLAGLEPVLSLFAVPQMFTGVACGIGYVAVFGLIGDRLTGRPLGPVGTAVAAVGKRSMTCYLAQSVLCAPLLAAWGLGLGTQLGSAMMAVFAVGVWLVTVLYADLLERHGKPGPAETLLRRLTYRQV